MSYSVEEGRLEEIRSNDSATCPTPSRLVRRVIQGFPKLTRRRPNFSHSLDSLDLPESQLQPPVASTSGNDTAVFGRGGSARGSRRGRSLRSLFQCQGKRFSADDTCVETISKDLMDEDNTVAESIYYTIESDSQSPRPKCRSDTQHPSPVYKSHLPMI